MIYWSNVNNAVMFSAHGWVKPSVVCFWCKCFHTDDGVLSKKSNSVLFGSLWACRCKRARHLNLCCVGLIYFCELDKHFTTVHQTTLLMKGLVNVLRLCVCVSDCHLTCQTFALVSSGVWSAAVCLWLKPQDIDQVFFKTVISIEFCALCRKYQTVL